jgi:hypothetical protein
VKGVGHLSSGSVVDRRAGPVEETYCQCENGDLNRDRLFPAKSCESHGLPPNRLGVYLPGKLRADNRLACPLTTARAMDPANFMHVAGANLSSFVKIFFVLLSQNSHSCSKWVLPHQSYLPNLPTRESYLPLPKLSAIP